MYLVTGKITKQNVNDSFYTIADPITPPEIREHWISTYKDTGKCLIISISISENNLEMNTLQYWLDQASYEEYKNDPVLIQGLFNLRNTYWSERGISAVIVSEENV